MNKRQLGYALGALGAASGVGMAGHASATTIYPDIPVGQNGALTEITLAGANSPQYAYYNNNYTSGKNNYSQTLFGAYGTGELSGPNPTGAFSAQTYSQSPVDTYDTGAGGNQGVTSLDLSFMSGGVSYYGEAIFDPTNEELTEIDYGPAASGFPEPDAWALLLAGTGIAGAAIRTRRRKEAPAA